MAAPKGHRPQLDALRTLAVTMVAVYHWHHPSIGQYELHLGFLGVGLFFVLSGYLITTILFGVRTRLDASGGQIWPAVRAFYVRRFLRLLPAYYFYLFVIWMTGLSSDPEGLVWYLLYAGNFRFANIGWQGELSHLWSLAVEEQFYLLAPIAMLLVPPRYRALTLPAALTVIVIGLYALPFASILPPGAFVGLLVGCLLAAAAHSNTTIASRLVVDIAARSWVVFAVVWVLVFCLLGDATSETRIWHAVYRSTAYLSMAGLVWTCAVGVSGPIRMLLEWKPILWLGKVSYGLYLWHSIAPYFTNLIWPGVSDLPAVIQFGLFTICTLVITSVSWFVVERPFLDAKNRFPYIQASSPEVTTEPMEQATV